LYETTLEDELAGTQPLAGHEIENIAVAAWESEDSNEVWPDESDACVAAGMDTSLGSSAEEIVASWASFAVGSMADNRGEPSYVEELVRISHHAVVKAVAWAWVAQTACGSDSCWRRCGSHRWLHSSWSTRRSECLPPKQKGRENERFLKIPLIFQHHNALLEALERKKKDMKWAESGGTIRRLYRADLGAAKCYDIARSRCAKESY
jgi:hypothetical protein